MNHLYDTGNSPGSSHAASSSVTAPSAVVFMPVGRCFSGQKYASSTSGRKTKRKMDDEKTMLLYKTSFPQL